MEEFKVSKRGKKKDRPLTFVEHLDKLRVHLFRGIFAILIFSVIAFFFKGFIFNEVVLKPKKPDFYTNQLLCQAAEKLDAQALCINQNDLEIINIDLAGQFKAHLLVSIIFGFLIAFPYLIFELWRFIKPALKAQEIKYSRSMVFWVSILFSIGILFGYFIIVPLAVNFLGNYSISDELENTINFASYFSTLATTVIGTGLIFEMPIAAFLLAKLGIITPKMMKKYRKHAIVVALILSGILTPPDVFSQILVAVPIAFLYELSILIVIRVHKRRRIPIDLD
ncbi:MAG: twin-arginine translocase subunit TatC [Bacteroidales bacterium]|nr:twin-arginine translocase subunit TatC [Bacteroidales bacterium]